MMKIVERCYINPENFKIIWEKYFSGMVNLTLDELVSKVDHLYEAYCDRGEMNVALWILGTFIYVYWKDEYADTPHAPSHNMSCLSDAVTSSYTFYDLSDEEDDTNDE